MNVGVHFWRVIAQDSAGQHTSFTWEFRVAVHSETIDNAFGNFADFDGDGYADMVLSRHGRLSVFGGGAEGLRPSQEIAIPDPIDLTFGDSVATADVNGDGYSDLVVGAPGIPLLLEPGRSESSTGVVYIYRGGQSGLTSTPTTRIEAVPGLLAFGNNLASLADTDGDGYGDIGVASVGLGERHENAWGRMQIIRGAPADASEAGVVDVAPPEGIDDYAGRLAFPSSATHGDFDGNGTTDILTGVISQRHPFVTFSRVTGIGQLEAILGLNPVGLTNANLSRSSRCDVNGDGVSDVVLGYYNTEGARIGIANRGGSPPLVHEVPTGLAGALARVTTLVQCIPDFDGDGIGDVIVSVRGLDVGALTSNYVVLGANPMPGASGLRALLLDRMSSPVYSDRWFSGVGDLDRDGLSDIAVSSYDETTLSYRVKVFRRQIRGAQAIAVQWQELHWVSSRSDAPHVHF